MEIINKIGRENATQGKDRISKEGISYCIKIFLSCLVQATMSRPISINNS
jgi:hypothetical protein